MLAARRSRGARAAIMFASAAIAIALAIPAAAGPTLRTLAGSRVPFATSEAFVRPASESSRMSFQVFLGLKDPAGAATTLAAVSDPRSASYARYLSPAAFRARFSRPASDVRTVASWLRAQGFWVGRAPLNHTYIPVRGSVAQIQRAFDVRIGEYRVRGQLLRAPSGAPSIPAALAGLVRGVLGLDDTTMVAAGVPEIDSGGLDGLPAGRARRLGGGRRRAEGKDRGFTAGAGWLVEAAARGDRVAGITWCSVSLREVARRLAGLGFCWGKDVVARMMRGEGCGLQVMSRWEHRAARPAGGEPGTAVSPRSIRLPLPVPW